MEDKSDSNNYGGNGGSNTATTNNQTTPNSSATSAVNPDVEVEFEVTYPIRSHHPVCALWNAAWLVSHFVYHY